MKPIRKVLFDGYVETEKQEPIGLLLLYYIKFNVGLGLFYSLPNSSSTVAVAYAHGFYNVINIGEIGISEKLGDIASDASTGASQRMTNGDSGTPNVYAIFGKTQSISAVY